MLPPIKEGHMARRRRNTSPDAEEHVATEHLENVTYTSDQIADVFTVIQPSAEELMQRYGVTWRTHEGRRVLNVPSTAPESAVREICAALAAE